MAARDTGGAAARARELAAGIKRPLEDSHLEQLGERYRATREFSPRVLEGLRLRANPDGEKLLEAVEVLRDLNRRGARRVPDDAPVAFVPRSWRPYVRLPGGGIDRHHWELCLLSELRGALRAGEIWVAGSRRYTDPERFLIPRTDWPVTRSDVLFASSSCPRRPSRGSSGYANAPPLTVTGLIKTSRAAPPTSRSTRTAT